MSSKKWKVLDIPCHSYFFISRDSNTLCAIHPRKGFVNKYSFMPDEWVTMPIMNRLPSKFSISVPNHVAINSNKMYVCSRKHNKMAILEMKGLNEYKWQIDDYAHYRIASAAKSIIINNELHIIGGGGHGRHGRNGHLKYNQTQRRFELLHYLVDIMNIRRIIDHKIVQIKSKVYVMGGYNVGTRRFSDGIHEYDIINNSWSTLKITLPKPMGKFGCTTAINKQYVLLFGGKRPDKNISNEIWIYTVHDKSFKKSRMKCPKKSPYRAFAINNRNKDELVTFGYVRNIWKIYEIDDHLFPPQYLIRIIFNFYWREYVHLFEDQSVTVHWRIDVFDIIFHDIDSL